MLAFGAIISGALCVWGGFLCMEFARRDPSSQHVSQRTIIWEGRTLANSKSARKRIRTNERNRIINRPYRSASRTLVKRAELAIQAGDQETATEAVNRATAMLDRAYSKNVIHRNNAARRKSRLMAKFNAAFSA